eukprot:TRINITY_DN19433_c0_g1_i3.p1 TRINITY_DN19433_c0_g1~~TRINITY_DN19433_c0_g1_i3.p1  ORF type:complete len:168 (+),score=38.89 TRINITY_DN19433_c0_g1_i3:226-729(+)
MIAPAVGADEDMIPNFFVVQALRLASTLLPSLSLPATPFEEPAGYCASDPPPGRNFRGHWPLRTAHVLLKLTMEKVPEDCTLPDGFFCSAAAAFPAVVAKGRGDAMVPDAAVEHFVEALSSACSTASVRMPRVLQIGSGHQPLMGQGGLAAAELVAKEIAELARVTA